MRQLIKAETSEIPPLIREMPGYRRWIDPELKRIFDDAPQGSKARLHAGLALLAVDDSPIPYLLEQLLIVGPAELRVLREALEPHRVSLTPRLWSALATSRPGEARLLSTASALALYDGEDSRWAEVGGKVARSMVTVNPIFLCPWIDLLRPVKGMLTAPLADIFRDKAQSESEHTLATIVLADFAGDDPDLLANLLLDADEKPFAVLCEKLRGRMDRAVPLMEAELARKPAPGASSDDEGKLAQRQARAAASLVRLGRVEKVWTLLRHRPDPTIRSLIVTWLKPLGIDPTVLAAELHRTCVKTISDDGEDQRTMEIIFFDPQISERRALVLALGNYEMEAMPPSDRATLVARLLELYRNDLDSGVHGALEWTLRKWGQLAKLREVDEELKGKERGRRNWYVNSQGETMIVVKSPLSFMAGSGPKDKDALPDEAHRRGFIKHDYAISNKEMTYDRYREFSRTNPSHRRDFVERYNPDLGGPQLTVTWYDVAAYCNWLSKLEGLEPFYETNAEGEYAEGMKISNSGQSRTGYRLPTELEWEFACRAGTTTSRYFGTDVSILRNYAWYGDNSGGRAHGVGQLMPNDLGTFDMLGNVIEWVGEDKSLEISDFRNDGPGSAVVAFKDGQTHIVRGGAFVYPAADIRASERDAFPSLQLYGNGFRICRLLGK